MKKVLAFLLIMFAVVVAAGFLLPRQINVERSITIARPASTVFTILNSFTHFDQWSPWASLDPEAVFTRSGPEQGTGARLAWSGDPALIGTGWQEITSSTPYTRIDSHLNFGPQGVADSYFVIRGDGLGSSITWGFDTDVTEEQDILGAFLGRYFGLFLDDWVGKDYEKGLQNLKAYAEGLPATEFVTADIQLLEVSPREILYVSGRTSRDPDVVANALAVAYGELMSFIYSQNIPLDGEPVTISRSWDDSGYEFDAAMPVAVPVAKVSGNVRSGMTPSGKAVRIVHRGGYDSMGMSYDKLAAYMAAHGLQEGVSSWEHYLTDPGETAEDDLVTHIYFLVKE